MLAAGCRREKLPQRAVAGSCCARGRTCVVGAPAGAHAATAARRRVGGPPCTRASRHANSSPCVVLISCASPVGRPSGRSGRATRCWRSRSRAAGAAGRRSWDPGRRGHTVRWEAKSSICEVRISAEMQTSNSTPVWATSSVASWAHRRPCGRCPGSGRIPAGRPNFGRCPDTPTRRHAAAPTRLEHAQPDVRVGFAPNQP